MKYLAVRTEKDMVIAIRGAGEMLVANAEKYVGSDNGNCRGMHIRIELLINELVTLKVEREFAVADIKEDNYLIEDDEWLQSHVENGGI